MAKKSRRMRWLIKGAKMNDAKRMYLLGISIEGGIGFEPDITLAAYWISQAASCGYAPAIEWMNDYLFDDDADVQAYS